MADEYALPDVPVKHPDFINHVNSNLQASIPDLVKPYNEYDAVLRKIYAQQPSHPAVADNLVNIVPLYDTNGSADLCIRARDLTSESEELKSKFLIPLKPEDRKPSGSPAVVSTFKEFQTNFNLFSESSLSDLDWNNVVAAGSAATTSLLPVPEKYRHSKRGLREYYHEKFAPASDVDLFLYGLTEDQAIEKIKQIETRIKDSILSETSTIRTKNAITIVSQYPTRHVQIVLRIYKSIAEILTGFDVDCSCVAYDGHQVYISPRAVGAFVTQINHVDLSRRSPSYENRLSKYARRGFEVFWPLLDRSQIDPTIFERSFNRTLGLARLLVLEKLPKPSDRDAYIEKRRRERGRPASTWRWQRLSKQLRGNIKNDWDDEVPDWDDEEDVSDYHTFTIPYGQRFHARKIEKLLYTKDLLLNAEWNRPKDREVNLHRHPAFFGNFEDVIEDCCGFCPAPVTSEEEELAEEENKIYVSGKIAFLKDNPGRQEIGSFNPITETDWTEMAYVGNTAGLCQAIVDHDLEGVKEWLSQGHDVNRRDFTGRTPLHLAVMTSTPEIAQCLVDHGARLISRLVDGRTALHLAAARGSVEMIRTLLTKSEQNEEEEARKEQSRKEALAGEENHKSDEDEDAELISHIEESEADDRSFATGSFVKVKAESQDEAGSIPDDSNDQEPDIYDINVVAWDNHASPLHLAIVNGHVDAVEELVSSFGADVLLPIKLLQEYNNTPRAAILTLVLALQLPIEQAKAMTSKLLQLGASPAQADIERKTPVTYIAASPKHTELLDLYLQHDRPAVERTINFITTSGWRFSPSAETALTTAIKSHNVIGAFKLLKANASSTINFDDFIKLAQETIDGMCGDSSDQVKKNFNSHVAQPVILAVMKDQPSVALGLLARGADPNTLTPDGHRLQEDNYSLSNLRGESLLDCVRQKLKDLREYKPETCSQEPPEPLADDDNYYLAPFQEDTYQMWIAKTALHDARTQYQASQKAYEDSVERAANLPGLEEKKAAVRALLVEFEKVEAELMDKEAKTFRELYPDIKQSPSRRNNLTSTVVKPTPFAVTFDFRRPDLNEATRGGYIQLFEAAWRGDLETIKSLAMGMWGPEKQFPPLEIATKDHRGLHSFHVAVMRGHLAVAKAMMAIAGVQYKPQATGENVRYTMRAETDDGDDDSCSDEEADRDQTGIGIGIEKHILDDRFTIENIGEVKTQVESRASPLSILTDYCPVSHFLGPQLADGEMLHGLVQYAIWKDDLKTLDFILELSQELSAKGSNSAEEAMKVAREADIAMAMRLGRLRCLKELIERTGAGLPLDKLAGESGVEIKEKPKFYQGLSIHGKKRADWAAAGRGILPVQSQEANPPLLAAARQGNLEMVEWFLGTAPGRFYANFAKAYKHDSRVKRLAMGTLGIERSITNWLDCRRHLVLHCAILAKPTEESERLVEYLVPHCMEVKSVDGYTPLALAFLLHRFAFARILIGAGANQTVRDKKGNNILHLLLNGAAHPNEEKLKVVPQMLELIDPTLVSSLLVERSSQDPGSLTPLAQWMVQSLSTSTSQSSKESDNQIKLLKIVLDFAEGMGHKHLEVLDGAGNTVVHDAVRCGLPRTLEMLLERRPDLVHRENASGTTPAELAESAWIAEVTTNPPKGELSLYNIYNTWSSDRYSQSLVFLPPSSFVDDQAPSLKRKIYDVCRRTSEGLSSKRRLVTLFEANEVARRLATKYAQDIERSGRGLRSSERGWNRNADECTDEVRIWLPVS